MFTNYQRNERSQLSDNRPSGALKIGVLNGTKAFQNSVSLRDKVDFYSFRLTGRSNFRLSLSRLQNNVDVFLQGAGVKLSSRKGGKKTEAIAATLKPGTYYIRVQQKSGNSRYRLALNATPNSAPNPNPSSRRLVSLGLPAAVARPRYAWIDLSTASLTELPLGNSVGQLTLNDIASFNGETYAIDLLGTFCKVDTNTGNYTRLGDLGGFLAGITFESLGFDSSGTLYTIGSYQRTPNLSGLFKVDLATGATTLVANIRGIVQIGDIAYNPAIGRFYASANTASTSNSLLYSISPTGDTQFIGDIGFSQVDALLFDNGSLYGYDSRFGLQQQQIVINTTTGAGRADKGITLNGQESSITGGA
jgi:hypothetical protein